ncbi:MAG: hypothetical protein JSV51_10075 [Candidatus Bathyarchaeota archaeon]|nr:MAG: hypothetical protein JSV51_10075 [Candidatus Bathyarchaeota archaeon]
MPIAYINIRLSVHATEDREKVKKAIHNLLPEDHVEDVELKQTNLKGYYNNPIVLFETRIKDAGFIRAFIEKLSRSLSEIDKEEVYAESKLFVDKKNLYLRLDKQAAFKGEFKLKKADPIHIRIHFSKKGESTIIRICRELGLMA